MQSNDSNSHYSSCRDTLDIFNMCDEGLSSQPSSKKIENKICNK